MTVQPHIAQARSHCLRCAVDTRTTAESPAQIIARATEFEAYVLRDNAREGAAPTEPKAANGKSVRQQAGQPHA